MKNLVNLEAISFENGSECFAWVISMHLLNLSQTSPCHMIGPCEHSGGNIYRPNILKIYTNVCRSSGIEVM